MYVIMKPDEKEQLADTKKKINQIENNYIKVTDKDLKVEEDIDSKLQLLFINTISRKVYTLLY